MINIGLSKGRIEEDFFKILEEKNIVDKNFNYGRNLLVKLNDLNIYLVKSLDICGLLDNGFIDIGIIGSDVIEENNNNSYIELLDLNTGICNFALASLPSKRISEISTIATKYPNIARKLLEEIKLNCEIVKMNGSLELAPLIGYSDAIIDLVQTGNTLKENGLIEIKRLEKISTKIICKKDIKDNQNIKKLINELK